MRVIEGRLRPLSNLTLGECAHGDVVCLEEFDGNPYLVVDPQTYKLYVHRGAEYKEASYGQVIVVSLADSRLRKLRAKAKCKLVQAEVYTE